jgi:hypothetical protein
MKKIAIVDIVVATLLVIIHTLDMQLTQHFIGDNWEQETFPPMSLCIKHIGIYNAEWVSRIIIYSLLFIWCFNRNKKPWRYLLYVGTTLYYAAMINWLFTLNLVSWP